MEQRGTSEDEAEDRGRPPRSRAQKAGRKALRLTAREYLPMALILAFWAIVALRIGHADAARLLAATVLVRAPLMLTQMSTLSGIHRRVGSAPETRKSAFRLATIVQVAAFAALVLEVALLTLTLVVLGQILIAHMLPLVALGYPARLYRALDPRTRVPYLQSLTALGGIVGAGIALALGAGPLGFAIAFGLRDWVALAAVMIVRPASAPKPQSPTDAPLRFAEIARNTVVSSRRLITYRLTKNILTVFGPFGNFAARTGRGFNLHGRLEPYMPHRRAGFAIFALIAATIAVALVARSGEPVAMIAAAGALQLCALALSVLLWWRFLPQRDDPLLVPDDQDDDD